MQPAPSVNLLDSKSKSSSSSTIITTTQKESPKSPRKIQTNVATKLPAVSSRSRGNTLLDVYSARPRMRYSGRPRLFSRDQSKPIQSKDAEMPYLVKPRSLANNVTLQRDNKQLSTKLMQRNEDYKYAVEINESLSEENKLLKQQIEDEILNKRATETHLNEKIDILANLVTETTQKYKDLQCKNEILISQNRYDQETHSETVLAQNMSTKVLDFLQQQLELSYDELLERDNKIIELKEELKMLKREKKNLQKMNGELEEMLNNEKKQHIEIEKTNEQQIIYLSVTNANLKQQRKELEELLEQREYGLTKKPKRSTQMFTRLHSRMASLQQLEFQQSDVSAAQGFNLDLYIGRVQSYDANLSDDDEIMYQEQHLLHVHDAYEVDDHESANAFVAEMMEDEEFMAPPIVRELSGGSNKDKIMEYLHLTAAAVKMKYANVEIEIDELIKKVESLSFHQYHDEMVRIMEMEAEKSKHKHKVSIAQINSLMAVQNRRQIFEAYSTPKPMMMMMKKNKNVEYKMDKKIKNKNILLNDHNASNASNAYNIMINFQPKPMAEDKAQKSFATYAHKPLPVACNSNKPSSSNE